MRTFAFHRPTTLYEMSALLAAMRQHAAGRRDDVAADHQAAVGDAGALIDLSKIPR